LDNNLFNNCKEVELHAMKMKYKIVKKCFMKDINSLQAFDIADETVKNDLIFY